MHAKHRSEGQKANKTRGKKQHAISTRRELSLESGVICWSFRYWHRCVQNCVEQCNAPSEATPATHWSGGCIGTIVVVVVWQYHHGYLLESLLWSLSCSFGCSSSVGGGGGAPKLSEATYIYWIYNFSCVFVRVSRLCTKSSLCPSGSCFFVHKYFRMVILCVLNCDCIFVFVRYEFRFHATQ